MTQVIEREIGSRDPISGSFRAPAHLIVVFAGLVCLAIGPELAHPWRGLLLLPLGVGLPTYAWERLLRRPGTLADALVGIGLIVTLCLWALGEFTLLVAGVGNSYQSSAGMAIAMSAVPLAVMTRHASEPNGGFFDAWKRAGGAVRAIGPFVLLATVGGGIVAQSMRLATTRPDSPEVFGVFWIGMLIALTPLMIALARPRERFAAAPVILLACATYVPTLTRSPWAPNLLDEMAHWGETEQLMINGQLFQPDSVVTMGPRYPGLETLAVGLVRLSGFSTITIGHWISLLCHIASLLGVMAFFRLVSPAHVRWAGLAAAVYAVSPSYLQMDTMYSYESMAVPIAIWCIAVALRTMDEGCPSRGVMMTMAALLASTLVMTHHLTAFAAAFVLLSLGISVLIVDPVWVRAATARHAGRSSSGGAKPPAAHLVGAAIVLAVAALLWAQAVGAPLMSYLGRFPESAYTGILRMFASAPAASHGSDAGGAIGLPREAFGGSLLPGYEKWCSFATQPVLFVWFVVAVVRARKKLSGVRLGAAFLGALYFLSLPFVLIATASAGAHRSWATSFVGLAATLPLAFRAETPRRPRSFTWVGQATVSVALVVVLVGSYAAAVDAYQQFPGPFTLGADGRTVSDDMVRSARWFAQNVGRRQWILTDQRTLSVFGSYAAAQEVSYPQWELFYPRSQPSRRVVASVLASGVGYVVVNMKLATSPPHESYFASFEPPAPSYPLPVQSLDKFSRLPWLTLVHVDGDIRIYQVWRGKTVTPGRRMPGG